MSSRPLDEPENGRAREASSVGSLQGHHYAAVCWIQPIPGGHNVAVQAKSTLFWAATKMRERGGEERRGGRGRGSRRHAGVGKPTRSGLRRTRRLPWLAGQLTRPVKQCVSLWSCGSRDALMDAVTTQRRQSTMGCDGAFFSLFIHIHIFFVFFLLPRLRTGRRAAAPPHAPPSTAMHKHNPAPPQAPTSFPQDTTTTIGRRLASRPCLPACHARWRRAGAATASAWRPGTFFAAAVGWSWRLVCAPDTEDAGQRVWAMRRETSREGEGQYKGRKAIGEKGRWGLYPPIPRRWAYVTPPCPRGALQDRVPRGARV